MHLRHRERHSRRSARGGQRPDMVLRVSSMRTLLRVALVLDGEDFQLIAREKPSEVVGIKSEYSQVIRAGAYAY